MRSDNFNFNAYNRSASKRPRYVVELAFDNDKTDFLYLTSHPDSEAPPAAITAGSVISNVVRVISGQSQTLNPLSSVSTIGSFSFEVVDIDEAVTSYISDKLDNGDGLRHKQIRLYVGFRDMAWSDYEIMLTYVIDGVTYENGAYKFNCSDIQRQERKRIFTKFTRFLPVSVTATQSHIPVFTSDLSEFPVVAHDSSYSDLPNQSIGYARIEDEIFAHTGLFTHGVDGTSFQVATDANGKLQRGALNTKASAHTYDEEADEDRTLEIDEHVYLEGPAPKIIYALLTGSLGDNLIKYSEQLDNAAVWGGTATATSNTVIAPDGTMTGNTLSDTDGSAEQYRDQTVSVSVDTSTHTVSFYLKAGTITSGIYMWVQYWDGATWSGLGMAIDLSAGSIQYTSGTSVGYGIESVVDGWYRVYISIKNPGTAGYNQLHCRIQAENWGLGGVATGDFYVWGAQATKTDYLTPYIKTEATAKNLTLPETWNLGIDPDYVALNDFMNIGGDLWDVLAVDGRTVRINGPDSTDGKRFIESELLMWLGCYMPIYSTGELGLKRLSSVLAGASYIAKLDDSNIIGHSNLNHKYMEVINQLSVDWNHDYIKGDFTKTSLLIDSDSILKHNEAPVKEIALFAVHTGKHTDADISSYFDTLRDRYSGPPIIISAEVLPSLNWLEVGDIVRVDLDQLRDFNEVSTNTLDRSFEVQRVQTNWMTGSVKLDLFASSQKAGALAKTALNAVLHDDFYTSAGTPLDSSESPAGPLTIVAGVVTANGTITGASTMDAAAFYYEGNLEIGAGVVVTITGNVQLRIRGALVINGDIDGLGGGVASGAAGASLFTATGTTSSTDKVGLFGGETNEGSGTAGYLGSTQAQSGMMFQNVNHAIQPTPPHEIISGSVEGLSHYALINNSTSISGLPQDLRGSSGGGGGPVIENIFPFDYEIRANGGAGGSGGSGLIIVCRGLSFGGSGGIDTSGAPGGVGSLYPTNNKAILSSGAGGGGAPGGFLFVQDGNYTPPELTNTHTATYGNTPIIGFPNSEEIVGVKAMIYSSDYIGAVSYDLGSSAYQIEPLPEYALASELGDPPPPDVTNFSVGMSGTTVVFRWNEVNDNNLDGYEIRYTAQGVNDWDAGTVLTAAAKGTRITDTAINSGDWTFYIKAYDLAGQYSQNAATMDATVVSGFDIIVSNDEHPLFAGTKTYFVLHHTGKLVPKSQNLASADDWETFDIAVVNPYELCTYESSELDISFDDTVRAWQEVSSALLPGETGLATTVDYMDYHLAAGSYDGFEVWGVGEVEARYFKFKFVLDTTVGLAYVSENTITADLIDREESGTGVTVAATTGTAVTFDQAYHTAPYVTVDAISASALFATASNVTTTGFTIDVYNLSGTSVGGTVNWKSTGV